MPVSTDCSYQLTKARVILKAHLNKSLSRNEYNIAVFQLKKKLVFSEVSIYRPVCLPPKCDHVCRTRNGKTLQDLQGNYNTLINSVGSLHKSKLISNGKCQKMINKIANPLPQNNPITKIKRLELKELSLNGPIGPFKPRPCGQLVDFRPLDSYILPF